MNSHRCRRRTLWRQTLFATGLLATLAGASIGSQSAGALTRSELAPRGVVVTARIRPAFVSSVARVTTQRLGATWHPGCPVGAGQLRSVELSYVGFGGTAHIGTMIVNESVVSSVIRVFKLLYESGFPIKEMTPESAYDGNDNTAAAADDTSGFNCRYAVAPGAHKWSVHAFGEAIDVNDVENPYIDGTTIIPPSGAQFKDRSDVRPGMAVPHGTLVDAFAAVGWYWGGRWTGSPDYQHFSLTGG